MATTMLPKAFQDQSNDNGGGQNTPQNRPRYIGGSFYGIKPVKSEGRYDRSGNGEVDKVISRFFLHGLENRKCSRTLSAQSLLRGKITSLGSRVAHRSPPMIVFLSYKFRISKSSFALAADLVLRCEAPAAALSGRAQFPGMRCLHLGHAPSVMRFCSTLCQ